jgi:hypothetical protein
MEKTYDKPNSDSTHDLVANPLANNAVLSNGGEQAVPDHRNHPSDYIYRTVFLRHSNDQASDEGSWGDDECTRKKVDLGYELEKIMSLSGGGLTAARIGDAPRDAWKKTENPGHSVVMQ